MGRTAQVLTWFAARLLYLAGWQDVRLASAVGKHLYLDQYRFRPCGCDTCLAKRDAKAEAPVPA